MHHGNGNDEFQSRLLKELYPAREKLGATGQHPEGQLVEGDEGEIGFAVGNKLGKVVIDFGKKPIAWVAMNPQQAIDLANSLKQHALRARAK